MVLYYIFDLSVVFTAGSGGGYNYNAAGDDISFSRYASASGRDGDERDTVFVNLPSNLRKKFRAAGYGGQPGNQLLYAAYY